MATAYARESWDVAVAWDLAEWLGTCVAVHGPRGQGTDKEHLVNELAGTKKQPGGLNVDVRRANEGARYYSHILHI